ncbi:hypothetical protein BS47DRAFT_1348198 [Hydnum rufescens UP504]|uniref:Indoleamine 2,3-dioxygenase n=1 Tax=Hydnum rufescens UP504 TaxID=1448309 RepID=A0A9P6DT86_9AGAM|nr:hypothetical protein BS47DRAFT_1348198 [Hydnum rufescens UP504]
MAAPPTHFLNLARRTPNAGPCPPFDVSTVAASDYDIDVRTGFMPPAEPLQRLPKEFEVWECMLDRVLGVIKLVQDVDFTDEDKAFTKAWRAAVRAMPCVSPEPLFHDERQLRRAHLVLAYTLHSYVHSVHHEAPSPIRVPPSVSIPLLKVSKELGVPPVLTYPDTVLWNWSKVDPSLPYSPSNIRTTTSFTGTQDENHFYMTSARIELRGVEALALMRSTLDETFLSDGIAIQRITKYLARLASVIDDITRLLMATRDGCDPSTFYERIRPWFNGGNAHRSGWVFEGVAEEESKPYSSLSGPSAGQSSLVHALDIFLGVEHQNSRTPSASNSSDSTFLQRQKQYMPRHHRAFLSYLGTIERPVRSLVQANLDNEDLCQAYDLALKALARFRDGHIRIATLYIVSQARKSSGRVREGFLRGSGGTMLVPFLKSSRDDTRDTLIHPETRNP